MPTQLTKRRFGAIVYLRKLLIQSINLIAVLFIIQVSYAAPVTYQFNGVVTDGVLAGAVLTGQFTLDSDPGLGIAQYKPPGNDPDRVLLAMSAEINGDVFVMTDEIEYPFRPVVTFFKGILQVFIGFFDNSDASLTIFFDKFTGAAGFNYTSLTDNELNIGEILSYERIDDADSDGVNDDQDNCVLVHNTDQRDTDNDGFGNICDPDLDNNNIVNFADIALWSPFFNQATTGDFDFNGDGFANFIDFATLAEFFLSPPGPSGVQSE